MRRAFPQDRPRLPQCAGVDQQTVHLRRGWLGGGVYLWQSHADAGAFYSGPWLEGIREPYGMDPEIRYFHTAAVTDNSAAAVLLPAAAE